MTETHSYPSAQSIPEAVQNTLIPESARKYSNYSKADLFDLVQKLEDEIAQYSRDRVAYTEKINDLAKGTQDALRRAITSESKFREADSLLKRADSLISESHCEKHVTDGKLEAYENVIGLLVTGKPGMGERDKSPVGPSQGLADLISRLTSKKTEH